MSIVALSIFMIGVSFLAVLIIGFAIEWLAGQFVSIAMARFGAFCAVAGYCVAKVGQVGSMQMDSAERVSLAIGAIGAAIWFGWRSLKLRNSHG